MKHISVFAVLLLLLLPGCDQQASLQDIENHIRAEVVKESAGIGSLQAIYLITYTDYKENWIRSNDMYVQKDSVSIDYGFRIDENAIRVIAEGPKKILQVRLDKGEALATNRVTIGKQTTHSGYVPDGKDGIKKDIDAEINREIESETQRYEPGLLRTAGENIRNFFKVLAAKYGLELDFQIAG